jgi:hypothetical protein
MRFPESGSKNSLGEVERQFHCFARRAYLFRSDAAADSFAVDAYEQQRVRSRGFDQFDLELARVSVVRSALDGSGIRYLLRPYSQDQRFSDLGTHCVAGLAQGQ